MLQASAQASKSVVILARDGGYVIDFTVGQSFGEPQALKATSALYANLANALFARCYAKLLIPRLGT